MKKVAIGDKIKIKTSSVISEETGKPISYFDSFGSNVFDFFRDKPLLEVDLDLLSKGTLITGTYFPYIIDLINNLIDANTKIIVETAREDIVNILSNIALDNDRKIIVFTNNEKSLNVSNFESIGIKRALKTKDIIVFFHDEDLLLGDGKPSRSLDKFLIELEIIRLRKKIAVLCESDLLIDTISKSSNTNLVPFYLDGDGLYEDNLKNVKNQIKEGTLKFENVIALHYDFDIDNSTKSLPFNVQDTLSKNKGYGFFLSIDEINKKTISPTEENTFSYDDAYTYYQNNIEIDKKSVIISTFYSEK